MFTNCIQNLSLDIHICLCFYEKCSGFVHVPRESCFSFYFKNKNNICSYHHTLATKILFIMLELLTPWTQDINWKYMTFGRRPGVYWTSYVRSIYVLCPGGRDKIFRQKLRPKWTKAFGKDSGLSGFREIAMKVTGVEFTYLCTQDNI